MSEYEGSASITGGSTADKLKAPDMLIRMAGEYAPEKRVIAGDGEQPMAVKSITTVIVDSKHADSDIRPGNGGPEDQDSEGFSALAGRRAIQSGAWWEGSGKSHFFVRLAIERCMVRQPTSIVFIREVQRVLKSSKRLVEDTIRRYELASYFEVLHDRIKTPGGGLMIFQGMEDHTAESIKSLEGFDIASVDEAQALSARSLQLLRPTICKPGSEIWFSWNPRRESDAVDEFFRVKKPHDAVIVQANWRDNPWFPPVLEQERQRDLELYPDRYGHIWEGEYARAFEGAFSCFRTGTGAGGDARSASDGSRPATPMPYYVAAPVRVNVNHGPGLSRAA